ERLRSSCSGPRQVPGAEALRCSLEVGKGSRSTSAASVAPGLNLHSGSDARAFHDSPLGSRKPCGHRTPEKIPTGTMWRGYLDYVIPAKAGIQASWVAPKPGFRHARE